MTGTSMLILTDPEYLLPDWVGKREPWLARAQNCSSMERASELTNDIEYLCLDFDKLPRLPPFAEWTTEDICEWFELGLKASLSHDYLKLIRDRAITGKTLANATASQLKALGFSATDAEVILRVRTFFP